jgi:hypothetical protein
MLLYANKKLPLPDPGKQLKKARPTGLSVAKIKAKTQDLPLLRTAPPRKPPSRASRSAAKA